VHPLAIRDHSSQSESEFWQELAARRCEAASALPFDLSMTAMSNGQSFESPVLTHIKRRAKSLKSLLHISHSEALDRAAVESGYHNYADARRSVMVAPTATLADGHRVRLHAAWWDGATKERGHESLELALSRPWFEVLRADQFAPARYLREFAAGHEPDEIVRSQFARTASEARIHLYGAARTLQFADATGLRPSSGYSRAYPSCVKGRRSGFDPRQIPGRDHGSIWFEPSTRRYVIVDEPYEKAISDARAEERRHWCEAFGYCMVKPTWPGMYAPDIGSQIYLFSSADKGVSLERLQQSLDQLPAPPIVARPDRE
jgi:hypothetical protein